MADARPEPSMEDILASIKRIIADDNPAPRQPPRAPAPQLSHASSLSQHAPAPAPRQVPAPAMAPAPLAAAQPALQPQTPIHPPLQAPAQPQPFAPPLARAATSPVFARPLDEDSILELTDLAPRQPSRAAAPQMAPPPAPAPQPARSYERDEPPASRPAPNISGGTTVEGLVREMLQPMLAQWIDTHLPAMVERLVQKEIERMSDEKR